MGSNPQMKEERGGTNAMILSSEKGGKGQRKQDSREMGLSYRNRAGSITQRTRK